MNTLHRQLTTRRKALGLRQLDLGLRLGMPRQQYQRLEAQGNPRLDTLELVAKGLNSDVMLIPREKVVAVQAVLEGKIGPGTESNAPSYSDDEPSLSDNPWVGLLGDDH